MAGITRESHYVPQVTLRRWSDDGVNVWAYQPLLATEVASPAALLHHGAIHTFKLGDAGIALEDIVSSGLQDQP